MFCCKNPCINDVYDEEHSADDEDDASCHEDTSADNSPVDNSEDADTSAVEENVDTAVQETKVSSFNKILDEGLAIDETYFSLLSCLVVGTVVMPVLVLDSNYATAILTLTVYLIACVHSYTTPSVSNTGIRFD